MSVNYFYSENVVRIDRIWRTKNYSTSNIILMSGNETYEDDSSNLYQIQAISNTEFILEFNNRKMELPKRLFDFNVASCFVIDIILKGDTTEEKITQRIIPKQVKPKINGEKVLFIISCK
jgi:hypothetical protein